MDRSLSLRQSGADGVDAVNFLKKLFGADGGAETQSVILLRQVPIRYDEPARSWLGGLPRLPEDVAWPRSEAGAPLQFVAQVCCADLPKGMWGGIGPRDGWLLLFVDCYSLHDILRNGTVQVLHVLKLGPEREPPEDMGTYRNAMLDHIDYSLPVVRPGIPKMWRRWPVDVIVQDVPEPFEYDGEMILAPNPVDPAALYGAPAADPERGLSLTEAEGARPLTWRGVLYLLDQIAHGLGRQASSQSYKVKSLEVADTTLPDRFPAGWVALALDQRKVELARYAKPLPEWESRAEALRNQGDTPVEALRKLEYSIKERKRDLKGQAETIALLEAYDAADADAAFSRDVVRAEHSYFAWIQAMQQLVAEVRAEVQRKDLDQVLTEAEWMPIRDRLTASTSVTWYLQDERHLALRIRHGLLPEASNPMDMALREDVLDLYTRDAAARAAIPQTLLDELEPQARRIGFRNIPHRMGGPRDMVQDSEVQDDWMLLFQIFSDDPMGWRWADVGGLFVFLPVDDLKAGRFDAVEAWVEGG